MKGYAKDLLSTLKKPVGATAASGWPRIILIFGDDAGLVSELAANVCKTSGVALDDPFLCDRISVETLPSHPGKVVEAANTISLLGGLRLVKIEGITPETPAAHINALTEEVQTLLAQELRDVLVVIPAPGLEKSSKLVKAVENAANALAVRCFADSARDVGDVIRTHFAAQNQVISAAAAQFLQENLGNDRLMTKSELMKVSLYAHGKPSIELADVAAVVAAAPNVGVFELCDAIGALDTPKAERQLTALLEEGEDLYRVSILVLRHLRRLAECQQHMKQGLDVETAMAKLKPPVMVNKPQFAAQVKTYPAGRLNKLAERFLKMQMESRSTLVPPDLAISRALLGLAVRR